MDAPPKVSIVILNFNGESHLEACLGSLAAMTFPRERAEVVLADNASTDRSLELVRERFPWARVVEHGENLGFSAGNDRAARQARGAYVAFLNNDTRVDPGWLEPLVGCLDEGPDVVCAGSRVLSFDGKRVLYAGGELNFAGFGFQAGLGDAAGARAGDPPGETLFATGCAMLVRREEFLRTGGFDEDYFAYYEDVDFGWRSWLLGRRVLYVPASVVYHVGNASFRHSPSEAKQHLWNRNVLYSMIKNYETPNLERLLPAALLLTMERALYFLDVEGGGRGGEERARVLAHFPGLEGEEAEARRHAVGVAHLRAVRDAVAHLPALLDKRRRIQGERKRSDADLFARLRLRLDFEDQVNELAVPSLLCRLLPWISLGGLSDAFAADDVAQRHLGRLEGALEHYRRTVDDFGVELTRKSEAIEHLGGEIRKLAAEVERLVPLEAELRRIQSKAWYKAVMATRRLRGLGRGAPDAGPTP